MSLFTNVADKYKKSRPSYPPELLGYLTEKCSIGKESVCLDVGCGTGIFTRQLAQLSNKVYGADPSQEMLSKAVGNAKFVKANAESLPFDDGFFDFVSCAQAFHWTDPGKSLPEFRRVLKPSGFLALFWNVRADRDALHSKFIIKEVQEYNPSYKLQEFYKRTPQILGESPYFELAEEKEFSFSVSMTVQEFVDLLNSKSYVDCIPEEERATLLKTVEGKLYEFFPEGKLTQEYNTKLFLCSPL